MAPPCLPGAQKCSFPNYAQATLAQLIKEPPALVSSYSTDRDASYPLLKESTGRFIPSLDGRR